MEQKILILTFSVIICLFAGLTYAAVPGDVNSDNNVNIVDALMVSQYYVGLDPQGFDPSAADTNCNGSIDIVDALLIAQYYVGLITAFPCTVTPEPGTPEVTETPTPLITPTPDPTPTPTPGEPGNLSILYRNRDTNISSTWIIPVVRILNESTSPVSMSDFTYRYWYLNETGSASDQVTQINYSEIGSANIVINFVDIDPLPEADTYMEVGFTSGAGSIQPGTDCGDLDIGIHNSSWASYDQSNDHSFGLNTDLILYDKITLYQNNLLIWGEEPNMRPVPLFDFSPATPVTGQTVTFDASASYDVDSPILSYQWDFGDVNSGTGIKATHRYSGTGTYKVKLTVTDDEDISDSLTKEITIYTGDPVPVFTITPEQPGANQNTTFDATDAFDPDGTISLYSWDFGDGSSETGRTVSHSYSSEMAYEVTLTVTDNRGNSDSLTKIANVTSTPGALLIAEANNPLRPFYGEGLGANIGLWTNNKHWYPIENRDPRLENIAREAGVKLIRFPAGNESDQAGFDRSNTSQWHVGPESPYERTMRADFIDAIVSLAEYLGADVILTVNAKIDNPEMAADVVKYCNVDNNYNVKFFEIGNEPTLYDDGTTPEAFAERVARYASAMRAEDPDILICAPNAHQPTHQDSFTRPFLAAGGGSVIDSITQHDYVLWGGQTDVYHPVYPSIDNLLKYNYVPYSGPDRTYDDVDWHWKASITHVERMMVTWEHSLVNLRAEYCSPDVTLGITELGPCCGGSLGDDLNLSYAAALWYADIIGRFTYNQLDYLTMFLLSGNQTYSMVDLSYNIKPLWYSFVMYKRYFGDMMLVSSSSQEEDITIWASTKQGEADKLYIMAINRHQTSSLPATIYARGFNPANVEMWEMNGPSLTAQTGTNINGIEANADFTFPDIPGNSINLNGKAFSLNLAAHSVNAFVLTGSFE